MTKRKLNSKKTRNKQRKDNYERRIREEHVWDKIFLLHIRKSLYVIMIWIGSMIIHQMILKFAGFDEPFFTAIALWIVPPYLLISVIYTLVKHKRIEG